MTAGVKVLFHAAIQATFVTLPMADVAKAHIFCNSPLQALVQCWDDAQHGS